MSDDESIVLYAKALQRPTCQGDNLRIGRWPVAAEQFNARHRKLAKAAALGLFVAKHRPAVCIAQRERQVLIVAQVIADDRGREFGPQSEASAAKVFEGIHLRDYLGAGLAQVEVRLLYQGDFYRCIAGKLKGIEERLPHVRLGRGLLGVEIQHPTDGVYGTGF